MIMLFDQEYAVNQYGASQKKAGRKEGMQVGRIMESVAIYQGEMNMEDEAIIKSIMKKFALPRQEAERYVSHAAEEPSSFLTKRVIQRTWIPLS